VDVFAPTEEIRERIVREIDARTGGGLWIEIGADGTRRLRPGAPAADGGAFQMCLQLHLASAERAAFRDELHELLEKYAAPRRGVRGARPHMVWLGMAPGEIRSGG
jgi:hypothetical protein